MIPVRGMLILAYFAIHDISDLIVSGIALKFIVFFKSILLSEQPFGKASILCTSKISEVCLSIYKKNISKLLKLGRLL